MLWPLLRVRIEEGDGVDLCQCVRAYVYESRVFVSMVLILIFAYVSAFPYLARHCREGNS